MSINIKSKKLFIFFVVFVLYIFSQKSISTTFAGNDEPFTRIIARENDRNELLYLVDSKKKFMLICRSPKEMRDKGTLIASLAEYRGVKLSIYQTKNNTLIVIFPSNR